MHWLIGENLYNENNFKMLMSALEKLDAKFDIIKVIPFSHQLLPEPDVDENEIKTTPEKQCSHKTYSILHLTLLHW